MALKEFLKKIPSNPDLIPEVEEYITNIAIEAGLSEEKLNNLGLSVSEAIANCIYHGNKTDHNKFVEIKVLIFKKRMEIIFKDEGEGFKPDEVPDPTAPENLLKDHGRGLHIMRNLLAELSYNFTDSGTETILKIQFD